MLKRKRGSVFTLHKTKKVINVDEITTVHQVKEELVAKELVRTIESEAEEAEKLAKEAEDSLQEAVKEMDAAVSKEDQASAEVSRQERVIEDIKNGEWNSERVFAAFDADNNGTLDVSELQVALTSLLGKEVSSADTQKFVKKFDIDGDGCISFDEFTECVDSAQASLTNFFSNFFSPPSEEVAEKARQVIASVEAQQ